MTKPECIQWSEWSCPYCAAKMDDPANIKETTCARGHMVYLGPPLQNGARQVYKTRAERRKDQAMRAHMRQLYSEAFKTIKKEMGNSKKTK